MKTLSIKRIVLHASLLFVLTLALCSCSARRIAATNKDATNTEIIREVEYKEIIKLDTVKIMIPVEVKEYIALADSSVLETSLAVSYAKITEGGELHHKLENKAREIPMTVPVVERETKVREDNRQTSERVVTVSVPLEANKWQKFFYHFGLLSAASLLFFLGFKLFRFF